MKQITKLFSAKQETGQGLVEYGLLLTAVALTAVGLLSLLGVRVSEVICQVAEGIGAETFCSSLLFFDDFSDDFTNWHPLAGDKNWKITNGEDPELCFSGRGEDGLLANGSEGTDYTVSVDANITGGNGYGLYFRASQNENGRLDGYTFQYDPGYGSGQFIMRKWVNGYEMWPPFAAAPAPAGFQWHNVERHIEVSVDGDRFTATIDGEEVLIGQDATYSKGEAGLRMWNSGRACFDNFTVESH